MLLNEYWPQIYSLVKIRPAFLSYKYVYMFMNMNPQNVIIASVIFLVILFTTVSATKTFVPYYEDTIFTHNFPYEGFEQMHHRLHYVTKSEGKSIDDMTPFLINSDTSAGECRKVYGFDGLFCTPSSVDAKLDQFADVPGGLNCNNKSSGLSNSKGPLCLDDAHLQLLRTRGGNQSGMEYQVGSK
jgi:hypothetical protein